MDKIKVFIASSSELQQEREALSKWINERNQENPTILWEAVRYETHMSSGTHGNQKIQPAINPLLHESEVVICLFFSKAGAYTIEEYETALVITT